MRILLRSGPLLLALGIALTGCNQSANPPQKVSEFPTKKASGAASLDILPELSQVVLTVEGMS
jgi:hypothetical protein